MIRRNVRDWNTENVYRDIFFQCPGILERNEWLSYMYQNFCEAEDPRVRNVGRNVKLFNPNKERTARLQSQEFTRLSLVEKMDEYNYKVFRLLRKQKEDEY